MGDKAPFDNLFEMAVLLVPLAVLLTLIALFLSRRNRPKPGAPHTAERTAHPVAAPISATAPSPVKAEVQVAAPRPVKSIEAIEKEIESAVAEGRATALSDLYLALADAHARSSNVEARMASLRSAAGYGALHGPHAAHAAARIALGDAAEKAGDMTSACEQWQLAKTAYLEAGDTQRHASIEKRMRENGCPTDWVLTDF